MESLVNKNNSLIWQGWDILFLEEDSNAFMDKDGVFYNDRWHKKTPIENKNGYWKIPRSVIKKINV